MGKASDKPIKFVLIRDYLEKKYDFRFNAVAIDLEYKPLKATVWETLNPSDLECELFLEGFTGFEKQLSALLKSSSFVPVYDPIRNYFETLPPWDQQTDYISQYASYVRTTDQPFFLEQFKKMMVRMIAQAYNTISFNKQCLTFYSNQNDGKTYFFENMLKDTPLERYSKKNPDVEGKEAKRALAENFLVNFDELAGFSKQEVSKIKAFFSESQIKVRLPYDKKDSVMMRKASFVGSTNKREFLVDETGNVRWLVFEVLSINHDNGGPNGYRAVDINNVWAQAFFLFQGGYPVQLSPEELKHSETNNEKYARTTTEYELLISHFEPANKDALGKFYQPKDLLIRLTQLTSNQVRLNPENIGRALTKMKVERAQHRIGQFPVYGYWLKENLLDLSDQPATPVNIKF
jgi:predicted P-loop ATPase